jgi:hypothetical protein
VRRAVGYNRTSRSLTPGPVQGVPLDNRRAHAQDSGIHATAVWRDIRGATYDGAIDFAAGSRVVLRVRAPASAHALAWWATVREQHDVPWPIGAMLAGRTRVELTPSEAADTLAWASDVSGWADADPKPLFLHDPSL